MRVLILGARAPVCLEWARVFKKTGAVVFVADSLSLPLCRFSNAVDGFIQLPSPATNLSGWLSALTQAIRQHGIEVLLPTCEEVFYVAHCLPILNKLCHVPVSNFELIRHLHHKGSFAQLVEGMSISAPETTVLETPNAPLDYIKNSRSWVFKPAFSRFAAHTVIQPLPSQLDHIQPSIEQPWVAQKFVAGTEFCSYSILTDGKVTAHACYQPLYRVGKGAGIYLKPVTLQPIIQFVHEFGQKTSFTGQVGFDFIQDSSGQCHVLECNPRATSGLHLLSHTPDQLISALLHGLNPLPLLQTHQPKMVGLAMLLFAAPKFILSKQFWLDFQKARDIISCDGDYMPMLSQPLSLAELCWHACVKRDSLLDAATRSIAWDGQMLEPIKSLKSCIL